MERPWVTCTVAFSAACGIHGDVQGVRARIVGLHLKVYVATATGLAGVGFFDGEKRREDSSGGKRSDKIARDRFHEGTGTECRRAMRGTDIPAFARRSLWHVVALCRSGVKKCVEIDFLDRKSTRLNSSHVAISYA